MPRPILFLIIGIVLCSMAVIELRHRNRLLFAELQNVTRERDQLNTEWGQLLLEQGAWSEHRRVEDTARVRLGMSQPGGDRVVVVRNGRPAQ